MKGGEYMNKKMLLTVATVSIMSGGLVMASNAFAQTQSGGQESMTSLVQKIADKFNINKNDVQAVFDQNRQEMQAKRETRYEAKLAQLVKDGKITEQQKQLLLDKHKQLVSEMQSNKVNLKSLTPAARKAKRQELQAWAKQNGVDIKYLMGGLGMRGHRGFAMDDQNPTATITASPTP